MRALTTLVACTAFLALLGLGACGSDHDGANDKSHSGSPEQAGAACENESQCYPDVAEGTLVGDALCLSDVRGGYCTHTCTADEDCCAAEGECATQIVQVCSPFQSTGDTMCFLSCESEDIPDDTDPQQYCQREANPDFICRSSGGGANNRKICVPGDCGVGAACGSDEDCSGDLTCALALTGGYCTRAGCTMDADCPDGSSCVDWDDDSSYCMVQCSTASDCGFCRGEDLRATCTDEVDFADGDPTTVCVPDR